MLNQFNPGAEKKKIIAFIRKTLKKQGFSKVVIGLSGGVDSTTCLYLLKETIGAKNIIVAHLYYDTPLPIIAEKINIPPSNIYNLPLKKTADKIAALAGLKTNERQFNLRLGNILARLRMIILYDLAKKHNALVCGTENRSEHLLGYFTRFGDQASDFEPIKHLYKTQVLALARYLGVPQSIIDQTPTAGLWPGQTDEGEFGFTYQEADKVLHLYYDKKIPPSIIQKKGFINTQKILVWSKKSHFKHETPYVIKSHH